MVNDFLAYASTKYASYDPQSSYYQVRDQQLLWNLDIDLEKLWLALHTGDFSPIPEAELLFTKRKLVYACVNSSHRKLYIGQATEITTRFTQHFSLSRKHNLYKCKTDRFHSFMAHNSLNSWMILPIFVPIDSLTEVARVEKRIIRSFGDSTLNSQHVLLRKRFVYGPVHKEKTRSLSYFKHCRNRFSLKHVVKPQIQHNVQRFRLISSGNDCTFYYVDNG